MLNAGWGVPQQNHRFWNIVDRDPWNKDSTWPGTVDDPSSPANGMWAKAAKTEGVPGVDEFFLYKLEARNQHHSAKILPQIGNLCHCLGPDSGALNQPKCILPRLSFA